MEGGLSQRSRNKLHYSLTSQILGAKFRQLATIFEQER